jgi:hypothetical protein
MNLLPESKRRVLPTVLLALLLAVSPIGAQEEAGTDEAEKEHTLFFDAVVWVAQPKGLEYNPATLVDPSNPFATQVISTPTGTETDGLYRFGIMLPGNNTGGLAASYFNTAQETEEQDLRPGRYVFGEALTHPLYAGVNYDGLADGYSSASNTRLRDWRIDYFRQAFRTAKVKADWSLGWRRVSHIRQTSGRYYALVAPQPPLLPPVAVCGTPSSPNPPFLVDCDLNPASDFAEVRSDFSGRGPTVGLDVDFELWRNRILLESGASFTVLRGKFDTAYQATNNFYVCTGDRGSCENGAIVGPPWDVFSETTQVGNQTVATVDVIEQQPINFGLQSLSSEASAQVIDVYLGLRWRVFGWFEVMGGFRSSRYTGIGLELRPKVTTSVSVGVGDNPVFNTQDITETKRDVIYEGFFAGVTFRFL